MSFISHIVEATKANTNFRHVLFTGQRSQLVVMDIKPGESIGLEVHPHVEQSIFILSGQAKAMLDGEESPLMAGDVLVVTPGTQHDVVNTGSESLKVYTIYAPANHIDGRIHAMKSDAEADTEDEEFGSQVQ